LVLCYIAAVFLAIACPGLYDSGKNGSVAQIGWRPDCPFCRTDLSRDRCDGDAERSEAVQDGDTDLELRDLTVEVAP